ncbi:MAG: hypothetical protein Ct9H300mP16_19730 [Pseudomonadota bacterium]|nr:MAG: hypothetical protein Ct9H300mP16_19730 [Pseudomonadota bacterium]
MLEPEDVLIETESAEGYSSSESEGFLVALDTQLTPALKKKAWPAKLSGVFRTPERWQDLRSQIAYSCTSRVLRVSTKPGQIPGLDH